MAQARQDLEGALEFLRELYDYRELGGFLERVMESLRRLIKADRVVSGSFDVESQTARFSMLPAIVKDDDGTVDGTMNGALGDLERTFGGHPLYRYFLQTGDGRAQRISQIMTASQFRRHVERDAFTRQLGAKYQMGLFFASGPAAVTVVLLARGGRDFTERERALLNRLHPHLVQAFRNGATLTRLARDVDELVEMLEGPTSSVIVLAGDGRVRRWTQQARAWIAKYCRTPFPAAPDRLPQCFAGWYQRQLALIAQETLPPRPCEPLIVDRDARQLTVQLIPDHFRDEHLLLLNEKRGDAPWSALAECGLTPRESEVLAWVAKGKTNAEVGAILKLSARTVQKHLEHIYQKLGVETRTTATVRVLKMLEGGSC
jgi:DNA-binding CsgD family transcriptional regulator